MLSGHAIIANADLRISAARMLGAPGDDFKLGFMLAENTIDLKQTELMINWCADVLDSGSLGTVERSIGRVAVAEALRRAADMCVQIMGGTGLSGDTIVEQIFSEIRAFRVYDGPTEVLKWSPVKKVKRHHRAAALQ